MVFYARLASENSLACSATEDYPLIDPDGEAKHGVKIDKMLERARHQKGKLFKHHTFFVTPNIPNFKTVKTAIETHNGKVSRFGFETV